MHVLTEACVVDVQFCEKCGQNATFENSYTEVNFNI